MLITAGKIDYSNPVHYIMFMADVLGFYQLYLTRMVFILHTIIHNQVGCWAIFGQLAG
jgi:hypothetical protein